MEPGLTAPLSTTLHRPPGRALNCSGQVGVLRLPPDASSSFRSEGRGPATPSPTRGAGGGDLSPATATVTAAAEQDQARSPQGEKGPAGQAPAGPMGKKKVCNQERLTLLS